MPRKTKHQTQDEKELELVLNSFNYSKSYFSNRHNLFKRWLRLYHQISDTKAPFRANLFVPLIYPIVSTILPRMVSNLPKFRYEPREESDSEMTEQMDFLTDYQLDRMRFFKKLKMWVKDTLMFGTGVIKLYWRNDGDYNDPDMELVDNLDFFPDPKEVDIGSGDFDIHRTVTSLSSLKNQKGPEGQPLYKNLEKIKDTADTDEKDLLMATNTRDMTQGDVDGKLNLGSPFRQSISKQIEVLEFWGVDEDGEEQVITVANRNVVIRSDKNPFNGTRPFVKMHIDPINHEFHGKGIIEPIEHLQLELNDKRNQRLDNVNLVINRMWQVLRGANVDKQDLVSRPGGIVETDILDGVRPLETPDVTSSAYQEESVIKQDAQNAVGVSDIIQGQITSANEQVPGTVLNKTATGAAIAVQQSGSRFKYFLQNIEDALKEFGELLFKYNQQFLDADRFIRIQAPNDYNKIKKTGLISKLRGMVGLPEEKTKQYEFKRINAEGIRNAKLDVKVESGSTQPIEDTLKQQKASNLLSIVAQLPVATPETYIELADRILEAYDVPRKDEILKTLQAPQNKGPDTKVSVSLKGDLNAFQVADISKSAGATDQSADPSLAAQMMTDEKQQDLLKELIKDKGKYGTDTGTPTDTEVS